MGAHFADDIARSSSPTTATDRPVWSSPALPRSGDQVSDQSDFAFAVKNPLIGSTTILPRIHSGLAPLLTKKYTIA